MQHKHGRLPAPEQVGSCEQGRLPAQARMGTCEHIALAGWLPPGIFRALIWIVMAHHILALTA